MHSFLWDAEMAEVEDGGSQRGVGLAFGKDIKKVLRLSGTAGRDHRDRYGLGDSSRQLAVETDAGAIAVHRRQEYLTGSKLLRLTRPGYGLLACGPASAGDVDFGVACGSVAATSVNGDDHSL